MRILPLLAAAALVLTTGACAAPDRSSGRVGSAEKSSAEVTGGSAKVRAGQPWWKLSQYSRKPTAQGSYPGNVRPGKGLLSDDEDGLVLYRKGEVGSSESTKPSKVRR